MSLQEVVSVDFSAQKVRLLSNDDEQVSFEKLVIATGSVPRVRTGAEKPRIQH